MSNKHLIPNLVAEYAFAWMPLRVKTRLIRVPGVATLRHHVFRAIGEQVYAVEPRELGLVMRLDLELHKLFLDFRQAEPHLVDHIVAHVKPGQVALDVGAYLGYYGLLFGHRVGPSGRVIAFEPFAANRDRILDNAELNGLAHIEIVPVALSDRNGIMNLYVDFDRHAQLAGARTSLMEERVGNLSRQVLSVPVSTLDVWVEGAGLTQLDWIKIDVEGAEANVLRGMRETLARFRPTVLIEFNDAETAETGKRLFEDMGYAHRVLGVCKHGIHLLARPI